ncbi:MAG: hypothetical protein GVY20_05055 [Bacteroidetes bacterium]|jgi:hypothetical protein|nr:hypothetical protein [Bacteroidota bacterium]
MAITNDLNDNWLLDAAVQFQVKEITGRWEVSLIFIDTKDPNRFLIKKIGSYKSKSLAEIAGKGMQRSAAKDSRGTREIREHDHLINNN